MPTPSINMIRNARLRVGEAPRSLSDQPDKALRLNRPWLGFGMKQGIKKIYDQYDQLLDRGRVVWASLVVARTDLFERGDHDGRGVVVYSPRFHVHDHLDDLIATSQKAADINNKRVTGEAQVELKRLLNDNNAWFGPRSLPEEISDDPNLKISSVLFARKHLPQRRVLAGCFPVLTLPDVDSIAVLPSQFWPQELTDFWTGSA